MQRLAIRKAVHHESGKRLVGIVNRGQRERGVRAATRQPCLDHCGHLGLPLGVRVQVQLDDATAAVGNGIHLPLPTPADPLVELQRTGRGVNK